MILYRPDRGTRHSEVLLYELKKMRGTFILTRPRKVPIRKHTLFYIIEIISAIDRSYEDFVPYQGCSI